ncbi:hypothetical protein GCM10022409_36750 [Hymenobacter glaciei]|uniref:Outer membrane protein beta-barrel domain-containing protein n=1 Tax=Hymenobacter glaciei TaxID=877209 RepID=A0ABP7UMM8_9BACT
MHHFYSLPALTSYLLAGSLSGAAQTAPAPASAWYVAATAAYHRYAQPETVHTDGTASPYLLQPAQVLLGHRFATGVGLEAGVMHSQRAEPTNSARVYSDANRDYYYYSTEAVQSFAVSLLFRAPLLHPAAESRWQLDSRVGLTYLMTRFTEKYFYVLTANPDPTPPTLEKQRHLGDLPITTGLAASYRLSPHLELTADASAHVSWVLGIARLFGTSGLPVGGGGGVGLRYNL